MDSSVAEQRQSLCKVILEYYKLASDRLPTSLIPRVDEAGFCFGFLDPVSNIIANTLLYEVSLDAIEATQGEQEKRLKKRTRSQTGTGSFGSSPPTLLQRQAAALIAPGVRNRTPMSAVCPRQLRSGARQTTGSSKVICTSDFSSIASRSLQGLVTFLTSYFRYLHTREALYYLSASNADLFVAVYLIEKHYRASSPFTASHSASRIALSCAALSAKHPQPDAFVSSSLVLASRLEEVHTLLQTPAAMDLSKISAKGVLFGADPRGPVHNAAERFLGLGVTVSPPVGIDHEFSMKRLLLDKIHGFYLQAIRRLPMTLLRSRLHRALLKAGHCYGPFDPVSNILLNTIWYDTTFPTQQELKVDVVLMESLALVESRSLHGLVASMVYSIPTLSMNDILRHLLNYDSLDGSTNKVDKNFPGPTIMTPCAYHAAAISACHPCPDALESFIAKLRPDIKVLMMRLLQTNHTLSVDDVEAMSQLVLRIHPHIGSASQLEWSKLDSQRISDSCKKFEVHQRFIRQRVEAALQEYARGQGHDYELHSICGVNAKISHEGKFGYFLNRNGYPFSHINAWVTRRDTHHANPVPTLLFIECSNDSGDMKCRPSLCCVVSESSEDAGRCFHCECAGIKIVHPSMRSYHGQKKDFEDMASGKHSLTNEELIGFGKQRTLFAESVETEPLMYLDIADSRQLAVRCHDSSRKRFKKQITNVPVDFFGTKE